MKTQIQLSRSRLPLCAVLLFGLACGTVHAQTLTLVSSASYEAPHTGLYVLDDLAFVGGMSIGWYTDENIGIRIVDLADPSDPKLVGRIPLRTQTSPLRGGTYSFGDAVATHLSTSAFEGTVAIVLSGVPDSFSPIDYPEPYGLWDVTDPADPVFLNILNFGQAPHSLQGGDLAPSPWDARAVAGSHFYALYEKARDNLPLRDYRLGVADISDPRNPVLIGDWQADPDANLLGLSLNEAGTRAYITGNWPAPFGVFATHGRLYVLDIEDPTQPTEIGRYEFPLNMKQGTVASMFIARPTSDDALVVLCDGTWEPDKANLHVLDTSDPAAIVKLSEYDAFPDSKPLAEGGGFIMATDVAIRGAMVYSAWMEGGLVAVDISDPAHPVDVARFVPPQDENSKYIGDVALLGEEHVVANTIWGARLYVFKDSLAQNPSTPTHAEEADAVPEDYVLHPNYPNPFNPSTEIRFDLPETSAVRLAVYDVTGREVAQLVNGMRPAGTHRARFDASGLPSGVYVYRLTAGAFTETRRMVLLR